MLCKNRGPPPSTPFSSLSLFLKNEILLLSLVYSSNRFNSPLGL